MTRKLLLSVALVGTIATAAMAVTPSAGPAGRFGGPMANSPLGKTIAGCIGRVMTLRSDLDVTDQQREQIRAVIMSHRVEIAETVQSVREKRVALRDLARSDSADKAQVKAAADALGQAISDAAVKAVALRAEIAPLFDQDQRATIDKFFEANDAAIDAFLDSVVAAK